MLFIFQIMCYHLLTPPISQYQMISDTPTHGLPGLEDVGIKPAAFEDEAIAWLRNYRIFWQVWDPIDGQRSNIYNNSVGTGENF